MKILPSYWQHDLDTHILSLVHKLSINDNLMHTNAVVHSIRRICRCSNLNLAPLAVGRDKFTLQCALPEFGVYALVFHTAFALNEW